MHPYRFFMYELGFRHLGDDGMFCPHIEAVTVIQDDQVTQVNAEGTEVEKLSQGRSHRGATICITFFTEDGQRHYRLFQFHKGNVLEQSQMNEPLVGSPSELWRD